MMEVTTETPVFYKDKVLETWYQCENCELLTDSPTIIAAHSLFTHHRFRETRKWVYKK